MISAHHKKCSKHNLNKTITVSPVSNSKTELVAESMVQSIIIRKPLVISYFFILLNFLPVEPDDSFRNILKVFMPNACAVGGS